MAGPDEGDTRKRPTLLDRPLSIRAGLLIALLSLAPQLVAFFAPTRQLRKDLDDADTTGRLGVQQMVRSVKRELEALEDSTCLNHEAALFQGKDFELEISFAAHANRGGHAGFHYDVLTLEGEKDVGAERVQKLMLRYAFVEGDRQSVGPSAHRPTGDATSAAAIEPPCTGGARSK